MATDTTTTTTPPHTPDSLPLVVDRQCRKRPWSAVETSEDTTKAAAKLQDIKSLILSLYECREPPAHLQNLDWYRAFLPPADFNLFITSLDEKARDWVINYCRCDWINATGEICVRMSNQAHAVFAAKFGSLVFRKLTELRNDGTTSEVIKQIIGQIEEPFQGALTSMSKKYNSDTNSIKSRRCADLEFFYLGGKKRSPLVVEVANSQKKVDLMDVAVRWIEETRAEVKTVVTVDLEYRTPSQRKQDGLVKDKALISIVRHSGEGCGSEVYPQDHPFQIPGTGLQPSGSITLALSDFCPESVCAKHKVLSKMNISITDAELRAILEKANTVQAYADQSSSSDDGSPPSNTPAPPRARPTRAAMSAPAPPTSEQPMKDRLRKAPKKRVPFGA